MITVNKDLPVASRGDLLYSNEPCEEPILTQEASQLYLVANSTIFS